MKRSILLPRESKADYDLKLRQWMAEGKTETDFVSDRFERNGWTIENERKFRESARKIGRRL
jgi:hypothetical protein